MASNPSPIADGDPSGAQANSSPMAVHGSMNWEPVRKRLLGPDLIDALHAATELRDGIEIVHTTEFPLMLSALLPAFSSILAHRTRPSADTASTEHKLRNAVLEIISRMPSNEVLRPHAPHLVALAIDILNRDYEDNALLASRLIFDLYKIYRSLPQDYVQPYLDFVQASYKALPSAVARNFAFPNTPPVSKDTSTSKSTTTAAAKEEEKATTRKDGRDLVDTAAADKAPPPTAPAEATTTPPPNQQQMQTSVHSPGSSASVGSLTSPSPKPRLAQRATASFKVLTECPLIVMLMFQLYPKFLKNNIPVLINVMMEALSLRAPSMQSLVPPNTKIDPQNKRYYFSRTRELVAAQAKTLSFLTYLLRGFSNELKPYEDRLASNVVALMSTCPRESISTRKELLVATRHLLNSDFRTGFFRHVDALLDERVLMGANHRYSEQTVLRPLGYTTLSDLIHHVKTLLNMSQMSRVVCMFSRILHDSSTSLPMSTQYTAVRTLLSVVDIIFQNKDPNPQIGRDMLVRILSTLVNKLSTLKDYFPVAECSKNEGSSRPSTDCHHAMDHLAQSNFSSHTHLMDDPHHSHLSEKGHLKERNPSFDGNIDVTDSVRDLKSMIRAIIVGHKTVIWYINNYRSQREKVDKSTSKSFPTPGSNEEVSSALLKMTNSERDLIDKYILLAIPCMQFLEEDMSSSNSESNVSTTSAKHSSTDQYRDALSYFAAAFTTLDGYDLKRTLGRRLDVLVDAIVEDSTIMVVPRHLLGSNSTTSYEFCGILLNFLVERMDALFMTKSDDIRFFGPSSGKSLREIESPHPLLEDALKPQTESVEDIERKATAYLQLFERVLKSLSVYPDNEAALRPHLRRIVATCLRSAMEDADRWPDNFCMLLRYVFRSISAGKFEESYKELFPLIPTILNGLNRVIVATSSSVIRNTIIELCLTVPARLSSLLPHMNLLLRVIVQALSSDSGDLVNLGLRTLEFWIDNLNPDFLYPELSRQTLLFTELMQALSLHLRPAPYPYGLLTLRLLGKLGGRNRRFLREPMNIRGKDKDKVKGFIHQPLSILCKWLPPRNANAERTSEEDGGAGSGEFSLPLPLGRCVEILRHLAFVEELKLQIHGDGRKKNSSIKHVHSNEEEDTWKRSSKLWNTGVEQIDFALYRSDVIDNTKRTQAVAALRVIRAALSCCLAVKLEASENFETDDEIRYHENQGEAVADGVNSESLFEDIQSRNTDFERIGLGLMFGCIVESTKDEAMFLLKGFLTDVFSLVVHLQNCFVRIDANGSRVEDDLGNGDDTSHRKKSSNEEGEDDKKVKEDVGCLKPFGYFNRVGALSDTVDPLILNKAIAEFLADSSLETVQIGTTLLKHLLELRGNGYRKEAAPKNDESQERNELSRGERIYFESLLSHLCIRLFSSKWDNRRCLEEGICTLLEGLGRGWGLGYEMEMMNVSFFVLKSVPRELSTAVVREFRFFIRVCCGLYGRAKSMLGNSDTLVWDTLSVTGIKGKDVILDSSKDKPAMEENEVQSPCSAVFQVLLSEIASTKPIVRIAARFLLKHYCVTSNVGENSEKLFKHHLSSIRRVIFSRSLRLLPLGEQVGAVEALAFLVREVNNVLPLSDQHLLAFLSELLKMSSVADGEMSDPALAGYVVDKNGNAVLSGKQDPAPGGNHNGGYPSHASALFFRRGCILDILGAKFILPEELSFGVQLRISSISLLHSVISKHPDAFFDAEVSTPIGNIRPHVVSLLFRSLVSNPLKAVITAHEALREVLMLSVSANNTADKAKSQSRLPKELLQTCIRPVLLNLREYTRLSVPLLRGLSRLLSLLSSWFNKTLGEKLLDHLQKWTDPTLIKSHKTWDAGEEPYVAAAVIDLFSLLPHASHFVEPLVKTTIKLEAYLPGFNAHCVDSPYRRPLARYLNKHCQYTVGFFFQRLKAPIYSELFQYIVRLDECSALRTYLSGRQCSVMMLNVCFERPLAIIRSEKTSSTSSGSSPSLKSPGSKTSTEMFSLHGIQIESSPKVQRESLLRQDIEVKKKKLQILQQDLAKTKEALQVASGPSSHQEVPGNQEEAQKQHKQAKAAFEKGTRELNEAKQHYAAEVATSGGRAQDAGTSSIPTAHGSGAASSPRPMTTESLELQHQGFLLVETLISKDDKYLQEHNDVVRAFRWLWRSKGRYLRLQHEDSVSPRFHGESKILVTFLIHYAKSFPNDVDVLFELIRIFLQPATTDFAFVRRFLAETVGCNLEKSQKKQIIHRFFALLAGESTEETKALSIQLLLFPLLSSAFTSVSKAKEMPDSRGNEVPGTSNDERMQIDDEAGTLVDKAVIKKFVAEVLYDKGHPTNCGDKLKVELLRVMNLILEHAPENVEECHKEIIRFCWSTIKSEDALCKSWAYVVVCRLISLFEIHGKYVLQVYAALLRSHQQEGKYLVRAALGLLVPALQKQLSPDDFKKAVMSTSRLSFEDGSVPQLAHIWQTIVMNPDVYYAHRHNFVRHMINSLNRLGLPPNSAPENRALAVSIIALLIQWDERQKIESSTGKGARDQVRSSKRKGVAEISQPTKKSKDNDGSAVPTASTGNDTELLDKSMVETIVNFLVRLKILLADPKVESGAMNLDHRIIQIFCSVLVKWGVPVIRPVYFEKIVSLCEEESAPTSSNKESGSRAAKAGNKMSKSSASPKAQGSPLTGKNTDSSSVTIEMLSACLDIYVAIAEQAPENRFLSGNSSQLKEILKACFRHASISDGVVIRPKLRNLIIGLYNAGSIRPHVYEDLLLFVNSCLDKLIADASSKLKISAVSEHTRQSSPRNRDKAETVIEKDEDSFVVQFGLAIIEEVCKHRPDHFRSFSGSLISLADNLVRKHLSETSAKQRQGVPNSTQSGSFGVPQMYPTPVLGVLEEDFANKHAHSITSGLPKVTSSKQVGQSTDPIAPGTTLRSLVIIIRLVSTSELPYVFTDDRKTFLQILGSILDTSDNVQLLIASVKVVGYWLISSGSGGPLTIKERTNFLGKIANFHFFNGVSDTDNQPLGDLVVHYLATLFDGKDRGVECLRKYDLRAEGRDQNPEPLKQLDERDPIFSRALVACLLNSNANMRSELLSLYATHGESLVDEECEALPSSKMPDTSKRAPRPRTAVGGLWQLLNSDYEGLGGRCWIVVFVELLLGCSVSTGGITPVRDVLSPGGDRYDKTVTWLPRPNWNEAGKDSGKSLTAAEEPQYYSKFLESLSKDRDHSENGLFECLGALRTLAQSDMDICRSLFEAILPAAWEQVPTDEMRFRLVPALEALLARPFHSEFFKQGTSSSNATAHVNSVRLFVNALLSLRPLPLLDTDLLVYLAENYNCWYEVLSLLEQQYAVLASNDAVEDRKHLSDLTLSAMRHCYRQLSETEIWMGLASESCNLPESKWALASDMYGLVNDASRAYSELVDRYQASDKALRSASDFELAMWEERWIELQRELCQQDVVSEYASISGNPALLLESAWKAQDWDKVRQLVASPALLAAIESGNPCVKMSETLLAVADGKLSDVENTHAQAAQLCLYQWQQLPRIFHGSHSHALLLHYFHRLVEIRESGQIMVETSNHSTGHTLPDLKNLLNAWRHRLPNDYERLTMWDDVFTWRSHMFSAITKNFQWSEPNTLATLHDKPWTAIRIAKTARKQDTRETALVLLNRLTESRSMDVTDAFLKLREQILVYDNPYSDLERTGGLNLINTTNLSFFDDPQKSELFRLKAQFLASLGLRSKSNQAFCHSVQICPSHARAWVSWGSLCSSLGALTEKQLEQTLAKSGGEASKETRANTAKKVAQYLAQSMGCYFEAIQLEAHEWARIHLPKCLLMLVKDGSSPGVVCQTLENRGSVLPPWVWLPWVPQLLACLCRNEGRAVKSILTKVVKAYPQAVYYGLRAFYLERRDVERSKGAASSPGTHMSSVAYAEEMMSTLRRSHASLWSSLESILEELIVKFRPSYEEELLATISALIERADSQPGASAASSEKDKGDDADAMVASVSKTLGRIAVKFFKLTSDGNARNDERARKTAEFKTKYKAKFEAEFKVASSEKEEQGDQTPKFTLNEYLVLLKRWRRNLEVQVASTPLELPLVESSYSLSLFSSDAPDLWPGSCDPRSSETTQPERTHSSFETDSRTIQSSTSSSAAAARKAATTAATAVASALAKEGIGGDYGGGSSCIEIPGQYVPNTHLSSDLKPCPELHAKLVRFEPTVEVLRREQLVRRIGMVGSDGRVYRFLLQFAIPYWTRTDERAAQTHFVLDKVLRRSNMSSRQHLSVQPTAVVPVAQRLRMTADSNSRTSLDEVHKRQCKAEGEDINHITDLYNKELSKLSSQEETGGDSERTSRVEVFRSICRKADRTLLLRLITKSFGDPEPVHQFRRTFSEQLAVNSLLQYSFSVAERTPARLVFLQSNGRILSPDFRVNYSSQGFIESRSVPFRLTPNLETLIGMQLLEGRFITSFSAVAESVKSCKDEMDPILRLLMRDDIVAWYCKSMAKSDAKLQELEKQLTDRVSKNVSHLQARFSECAPNRDNRERDQAQEGPVDRKVRDLISAATDPGKLCTMPTSYQAWL